jgi:NAD(P)H-hydrate epimerase
MKSRYWIQGAHIFRESGLITAETMRVVEKNAMKLGLPADRLMESAGHALACEAVSMGSSRPLVLCGRGNNGGDGFVAARYLSGSADVSVCYHVGPGSSEQTLSNLDLLRGCDVSLLPVKAPDDVTPLHDRFLRADLIIDAMIGTGVHGPVNEPLATMVQEANESGVPILSADIPTPGIRPSRILAFHRPKIEGSVVADIGIPLAADIVAGEGDLLLVPRRAPDAHKGAGGKVLVIGGGPYQGAPYLAALAALRAGADLVRVASPVRQQWLDVIHDPLPGDAIGDEHKELLMPGIRNSDVVVFGNGAGPGARQVIRDVAPECRKAVFDADALDNPPPVSESAIYTPHGGEFARMTGSSAPHNSIERALTVRKAAQGVENGVILLKGAIDIISDGTRVKFNSSGCPAMSVGGTGDVLAGIAGALFCRLPGFESAYIAAYVNGRAGEVAAMNGCEGILASDLLNNIPGILYGRCDRD